MSVRGFCTMVVVVLAALIAAQAWVIMAVTAIAHHFIGTPVASYIQSVLVVLVWICASAAWKTAQKEKAHES